MRILARRAGRPGGGHGLVAVLILQLPHLLRLVGRLLRDPRVPLTDRALVVAVAAYTVIPADLIPDLLGFVGWIDDLYLLGFALGRLVHRTGRTVLDEQWTGSTLGLQRLVEGLDRLASSVPWPLRRLLLGRAHRAAAPAG